jgi:nitrite reductase/ring-hydroxylating ferredoxin subunit
MDASRAAIGDAGNCRLEAPDPESFVPDPQLWVFACAAASLRTGAVMALETAAGRLAVFRGADGIARSVNARCPHLGSDLAAGRVAGDSIECPYHHFRFDGKGRCSQAALSVRSYLTLERYGAVFVFIGPPSSAYSFPEYDDAPKLISAPPIHWEIEAPWYTVGANAFDARHFRAAHGRRLTRQPELSHPEAGALRVSYRYAIEGRTLTDKLVRLVSGSECSFDVTSWYGNVLLVRAAFSRDVTYGIVIVQALPGLPPRCRVTIIVSAIRTDAVGAPLLDAFRVQAKRLAVRNLMQGDHRSLHRLGYVHDGLQPGDEVIAHYLRWVCQETGVRR